jgi:hypothetical protein
MFQLTQSVTPSFVCTERGREAGKAGYPGHRTSGIGQRMIETPRECQSLLLHIKMNSAKQKSVNVEGHKDETLSKTASAVA